MFAILPFEPIHYAMLPVRPEQSGDAAMLGLAARQAAELGPAFSAVEQDADGTIIAVLACGGLAENGSEHATAWAAFGDDLRAKHWSAITHAVRAVVDGAHYRRIDTYVRADWPAARRYAEALGFKETAVIYVRSRSAEETSAAARGEA